MKLTQKGIVACYESDYAHHFKPTAFLDIAQQIAVKGAQSQDFSDDRVAAFGCVWVLARMTTRFEEPLYFDEEYSIDTWHRGLHGLYFVRDYQMWTPDGKVAVNGTSSWVLMNKETRRLSRDPEMFKLIPAEAQAPGAAIEELAGRVIMPKDLAPEKLGTHKVHYSDIDYNGHVNNVKYTVWALDYLPEELVFGKRLREVTINFNREARRGDFVDLYHVYEGSGKHIIEGKVGSEQIFIETLVFDE